MSNDEAKREAVRVITNYIEILRDERNALPKSETSILPSLANKEIDHLHHVIATLEEPT